MIGGLTAIRGTDRKNEMFKQRPFLVAHQVSGQAGLHSRYQLESRLSLRVNPFCQHNLQRRKTAQSDRQQSSGSAHEITGRIQPVCVIKARKIWPGMAEDWVSEQLRKNQQF
jgi:hypothetical protein